jgi:hypothetical protein
MDTPQGPAAPASGTSEPDIPTFEELAADPEIAALLDFEPAPRKIQRPDGWTPDLQRELIARIAHTGSPGRACDAMDKNLSGAKHLYRTDGADSFRAAWKAAMALGAARKRAARAAIVRHPNEVPGITTSRKADVSDEAEWDDSEADDILNEYGEPEDRRAFDNRVDAARDSICRKLLNARRLYLQDISASPGKRAAFEILTELPIDWDKAARLEPQDDEPWNIANQRQPDMLLTAESGWSAGEFGYGPDRKAEARAAVDAYRASEGLPPVDWGSDDGYPSPLEGEDG